MPQRSEIGPTARCLQLKFTPLLQIFHYLLHIMYSCPTSAHLLAHLLLDSSSSPRQLSNDGGSKATLCSSNKIMQNSYVIAKH